MNPAPPPQPPQPHRPSTSCHRHPDEQFTGFCPSCLCERLTVLHPTTPSSSSIVPARKSTSSTAAAALRSVFRQSSSSFFPELRRSKSFSASKANEALSGAFEPQRKSCDVRVRGANFNLFNQDNSNNEKKIEAVDSRNQASSSNIQVPKEEEEEENNEDVIIVVEEEPEPNVCSVSEEIEIAEEEEGEELKTMKDHIDLDSSQTKKPKGSFWSAASVFSKKLQKWRQKQKDAKKQRRNGVLPAEKPTGRHFRETQSEVADYGFGRRSCDVDPRFSLDAAGPRFSLDAGRMSSDDPRYSIDEPRASLDGYLIGRAGFPRMPTMLSVVEDAPPPVNVLRTDAQIPVEEPPIEDDAVPGGSVQTREYYSDSSSRRRKSLDRSNSARKSEIGGDELIRSVSNGSIIGNAKVTPAAAGVAAGVDFIHGAKMGFQDRDLARDDCCSEVYGNGERKEEKKSRRWSIWGLIHRRGRNKDEDDGKCSRVNGVERCFSEDHLRGGGLGGRVWRSNSSVSWRNTQAFTGSLGTQSQRRNINGVQGNGNGKKGKDEFVLERNRSARYSPSSVDNGLLRFYLAPMGGGGRRNGSVNGRSNQAHSIARSVIGLY